MALFFCLLMNICSSVTDAYLSGNGLTGPAANSTGGHNHWAMGVQSQMSLPHEIYASGRGAHKRTTLFKFASSLVVNSLKVVLHVISCDLCNLV